MEFIPQFLFLFMLLIFGYVLFKRINTIKRNILLGSKKYKTVTKRKTRLKNLILVALGQSKMFKKMIPAILHLMIYTGFIIINIEIIEIILDGVLGTHRVFNMIGMPYYNVFISIIEFFIILVLISCIVFLMRRNFINIDRLNSSELKGWPILDANLILIFEIILMIAILTMNASDLMLQDHGKYNITGNFYFSGMLKPILINFSTGSLVILERTFWWIHIIGIFVFAVYVTYSKHLHIFLSFPNIYHSSDNEKGKMSNMDSITNEIKIMMGISTEEVNETPKRFGAKDITDLS